MGVASGEPRSRIVFGTGEPATATPTETVNAYALSGSPIVTSAGARRPPGPWAGLATAGSSIVAWGLRRGLGIETGVSLAELSKASAFIGQRLDHPLPSRYAQAAAATRRR